MGGSVLCRLRLGAVTLSAFISIAATALAAPGVAESTAVAGRPPGTITGQVMIGGEKPMAPGIVLLYDSKNGPPPALGLYWRVPDLIMPLDRSGRFALDVPAGTYFIQAVQKDPAAEIGPPQGKEYLYFHGDDKGIATPLVVKGGDELALGSLTAFLWSPAMIRRAAGITALEGTVVDLDNKPVERAVVLAYYSDTGQGRPVFISDRSDKNGHFQLRTNDGGTFFLKVRSVVGGGRPEDGEYLNTTREFLPVKVNLKKGEKLQGVTLRVKKINRP
jgi:hypothetical protein